MKGQPAWVMVSELVETSRLWGRTAARIDPRWVEPLAGHLLKRTFENPRWDRKRAQVVATERATLYGMPIVAGRVVGYGQIDPELSRDLFIRRALVEGEWDTRHHFVAENEALVEEIRALEERARRRDILVDDQTLYDFYAARVPETVISGRHFDRWWRDERRMRPDLLSFTRELLINPKAAEDVAGRPDVWRQGELELPLTYRFEPGSAHDGVTVHVPLKRLMGLSSAGLRVAGPGDAPGARRGADPLAAEGHPQAAHPGARGGGQRAQAPAAAQRAAAGGARRRDRGPARACGSRRTPGTSPACPCT